MSDTSFPSTPIRSGLRRLAMLGTVLLVVVALPSASRATSCSGFISLTNSDPQITCVLPQSTSEKTMSFGMKFLEFAPQSQGTVLIYNSSLQLADVVTFSNVDGTAHITFDANVNGAPLPNLPVIGSYSGTSANQGYIYLSLLMTNGKDLHVGICTSTASTCNGGGESLKLSVGSVGTVPEPGTMFMLGTGLLAPGAWTLAKAKFARRFLKQIKNVD